jgi:sec-independent protein translocase protein TatA
MIPGFHGFDLIIILLIVLLIFGPRQLPKLGASIGKSLKEYRKHAPAPDMSEDEVPQELSAARGQAGQGELTYRSNAQAVSARQESDA